MTRCTWWLLHLVCLPVVLSWSFSVAKAGMRRPNVVVILADDLGYGDLSCFGASGIATPNIDCIATEGTRLTIFYVSAVCSPTRVA